jgi:flagellar biosynthesis/type III secretory pathway M-ring protein FliF/YscJ
MNVFKNLLENARKIFAGMTGTQRASFLSLAITVAALLGIVVWIGSLGETPKYVPLNLPIPLAQIDATKEILAKNGIKDVDYDYDAKMLRVLEKDRYRALTIFAKEKLLPSEADSGFENALKQAKFTDTHALTTQRFTEALRTETANMIRGISGIAEANVIFTENPQKRLFNIPSRQSATVKVRTELGKPIDQELADTIVALVAYAKSGLEERDVVIVDQSGKHWRKAADSDLNNLTNRQLALGRQVSDRVERDVEQVVVRAVPNAEVTVVANTTMDLARREIFQHTIDGATARDTKKLEITDHHTDEPGNVVGTQPNIRRNTNMQPEGNARRIERNSKRTESVVHNDFSYTDTKTLPDPKIDKQTISVTIQLPYEHRYVDNDESKGKIMEGTVAAGVPNLGTERAKKFPKALLKDDEIMRLENSIRKAAGILDGEDRREVSITQIPWEPSLEPEAPEVALDQWREFFTSNAISFVLLAILLVAVIFLYWQAKKSLPPEELDLPSLAELTSNGPQKVEDMDRGQQDFESLRGQVGDIIESDPAKATLIVKRWMSSRDG